MVFLLFTLTAIGQSGTINCDSQVDTLTGLKFYKYVDREPKPKGGMKVLFNEFKKIEFPTCTNYNSRLIVAFIVDAEGEIKGKRVLRGGEGTNYAEQVMKLIDNIDWLPGICDNEVVPSLRMVSVRICL